MKYAPIAFSVHVGGLNGGHYFAVVNIENKWHTCDDSTVYKRVSDSFGATVKVVVLQAIE